MIPVADRTDVIAGDDLGDKGVDGVSLALACAVLSI